MQERTFRLPVNLKRKDVEALLAFVRSQSPATSDEFRAASAMETLLRDVLKALEVPERPTPGKKHYYFVSLTVPLIIDGDPAAACASVAKSLAGIVPVRWINARGVDPNEMAIADGSPSVPLRLVRPSSN